MRALLLLLLCALPSCALLRTASHPPPPPVPPVSVPDIPSPIPRVLPDLLSDTQPFPHAIWADSVLGTLDRRRMVAQMLMPFSFSERSAKTIGGMRAAGNIGVGGVIFSRGSSADLRALVDSLRAWSAVPPFVAADFEHGPGMRIDGALRLPSMMALGATRNTDLAYRAGHAIAAASRRVGVWLNFAPVADVNSNPHNPIINTRAFGETAELAGDMAEAVMRGMQDGGMLATAKHFPGHGDTDVDSHTGLPLLHATRGRLDSVELSPFRRLIDAGVAAVMSGHLAVPALTGDSSLPATLSAAVMDTLLRRELGFGGLVVTDAMNMKALTRTRIANLPAAAVRAGADILLIPGPLDETIDSVLAAIDRGELDSSRVFRSVRRILEAKYAFFAPEDTGTAVDSVVTPTPADARTDSIVSEGERQLARQIAEQAVTLVRNTGNVLPIADSSRIVIVRLVRKGEPNEATDFVQRLRARFPRSSDFLLERRPPRGLARAIRDSMRGADAVVYAAFVSAVNGANSIGLSDAQLRVLAESADSTLPRILLSLGSPYVLGAIPDADAMVCVYGDDPASIDASVRLLSGEIPPKGTLPVSIPGIAGIGEGLRFPRPPDRTNEAFRRVDSLILEQITQRATPGAQLAVLHGDSLVYLRSYGHLTYDSAATPVDDRTLYDLASLSKVVVTTTAAMQLVDEGRLHLDSSVASYLPEFARGGKEHVTIRHLLLHTSGLEAFRPFHEYQPDGKGVLDSILGARLVYETGHKTVYSDFGMVSLGTVIERITGRSLDTYASERILDPLGMHESMFRPPDSLRWRCAPTEYDRGWRRRLVQGEVHDETAALLGGVAGHAGLFSTAADLARFVRMLLGGGTLEGQRLVRQGTLTRFTTRQSLRNSRALGWDTKSAVGSSAGRYFSMKSFGHTGFTGTSIWVDPVARIGVVFLTNRVHPSRENKMLPRFRATLHDAVREALMEVGETGGAGF